MTRKATSHASITRSMSGRRSLAARSPTPRSSDDVGAFGVRKPASDEAGFCFAFPRIGSSANALQRREGFDQPAVQLRKDAGEEGDPGEHEQPSHDPLDMREMGAKAREEGGKRLDCHRAR